MSHLKHPAVTKGCHANNNLLLGNTVGEVVADGVVEVESYKQMSIMCPDVSAVISAHL